MKHMFIRQRMKMIAVGSLAVVVCASAAVAQDKPAPVPSPNPGQTAPNAEPPKFTERDVPRPEPKTPLEAALRDGIPSNAIKRARVRENLYALLATSTEKAGAKRVANALERVYLTSGSATVDLLMKRGIAAIKAKQLDKALTFLNAVTELAPDYAEGWNRRAYVFYKQNDFRQAVGDLRRVLALDPSHFKALDGLGTILRSTGDDAGALKVFEKLEEVHPFWPGADTVVQELKRKVEGRGI